MIIRPYDHADYELGKYVDFEYPESIPMAVRGKPILWRNAAHVGGLFSLQRAWNIDLVPPAFQERLCYASSPNSLEKHSGYERIRGVVCCSECERSKVYNSHWCIRCGSFFIRDFVDTRFCPAFPHCFSCLPELSWTFCPDHASPDHVDFASTGQTTIMLPSGFNPIDISEEELEDFINNELGIS